MYPVPRFRVPDNMPRQAARRLVAALLAWATAAVAANPEANVSIANFAFDPPRITVAPGDAVMWRNHDATPHSIVFKDGSPGAGPLLPGETFRRVFDQPGDYDYFCAFHDHMTGRVVVRDPWPGIAERPEPALRGYPADGR